MFRWFNTTPQILSVMARARGGGVWKNPSYVTSNWKNTPCISHLLLFGKLLKQVEHHGRGLRPAYIVYVPPLYKHCDAYMDVQCTYCLCRVVSIIGLSHSETKNSRKKLPFLCNSPDLGYCCSWYSQDNWSLSVNADNLSKID